MKTDQCCGLFHCKMCRLHILEDKLTEGMCQVCYTHYLAPNAFIDELNRLTGDVVPPTTQEQQILIEYVGKAFFKALVGMN